jgi:hypothetical protein
LKAWKATAQLRNWSALLTPLVTSQAWKTSNLLKVMIMPVFTRPF